MDRLRIVLPITALVIAVVGVAFLGGLSMGQAKAPSGESVGITVTGDWLVTVKNSDGTVAKEERFHNAFTGQGIVARTFAHSATPGRFWLLVADNAGTNNPCQITSGTSTFQVACDDFEADDANAGAAANFFGNLTATASTADELVVQGNITAQRNGQFDRVIIRTSSCGAATAPTACHPNGYVSWSDRTLTTPITVVTGQQILITVTYTFSSAP